MIYLLNPINLSYLVLKHKTVLEFTISSGKMFLSELSEMQNYAYWYARFFPGTHEFPKAGVSRTHVFLVGTR